MKNLEVEIATSETTRLLDAILSYAEPVTLLAADGANNRTEFEVHVDGTQTVHRVHLRNDGTWYMTTEVEV